MRESRVEYFEPANLHYLGTEAEMERLEFFFNSTILQPNSLFSALFLILPWSYFYLRDSLVLYWFAASCTVSPDGRSWTVNYFTVLSINVLLSTLQFQKCKELPSSPILSGHRVIFFFTDTLFLGRLLDGKGSDSWFATCTQNYSAFLFILWGWPKSSFVFFHKMTVIVLSCL